MFRILVRRAPALAALAALTLLSTLLATLLATLLPPAGTAWGQTVPGGTAAAPAPRRPSPIDPGTALSSMPSGTVGAQDGRHRLSRQTFDSVGLLVPDLEGGYVYVPGGSRPDIDPGYIDAQEVRLKARELAAQLLETWPNDPLTGMVAMPSTFVDLNDFEQTSALGRYLAEAMFYEFNTRGFATREYRMDGAIHFESGGEFSLTRDRPDIRLEGNASAVVTGTYHRDPGGVFVNARIIRASDGLVLRTAQLILPMSSVISRMSVTTQRHPFERKGWNGIRIVRGGN